MSEWISVKDRLPAEWNYVLTFQKCECIGECLIRVGMYIGNINNSETWREAERGELMELPVTHWMPLPVPPREVQKDEY